jgi:ankyrin repeat protein
MENIKLKLNILRVLVLHGADVNYEINTVEEYDSDDSYDSDESNDYKIIKIINPILSIIDRRTETDEEELDKMKILKFLLYEGADINKSNHSGETILNMAIHCSYFDIIDFILHKTEIDLLHRYRNKSYLMYIINYFKNNKKKKKYRKCINYIINKHPGEIHYRTPKRFDLISFIFRNNQCVDIQTLEKIIFLGIDLNYCNRFGFNALMKACNNICPSRRRWFSKRKILYAISILIDPRKINPLKIQNIRKQFNISPSFISPNLNETPEEKKKD